VGLDVERDPERERPPAVATCHLLLLHPGLDVHHNPDDHLAPQVHRRIRDDRLVLHRDLQAHCESDAWDDGHPVLRDEPLGRLANCPVLRDVDAQKLADRAGLLLVVQLVPVAEQHKLGAGQSAA